MVSSTQLAILHITSSGRFLSYSRKSVRPSKNQNGAFRNSSKSLEELRGWRGEEGGGPESLEMKGLPKMGSLFMKQEGNSYLNPSTNYVTFNDITWHVMGY